MPDRKEKPNIESGVRSCKSGKVSGRVRKFVNHFEQKSKKEKIYSHFSVFGPNKKHVCKKTVCAVVCGYPFEVGIFSGGKWKFGHRDDGQGKRGPFKKSRM